MAEFLFPFVGFRYHGKFTKGGGGFGGIYEADIFSGRGDVLGVSKTATTEDTV